MNNARSEFAGTLVVGHPIDDILPGFWFPVAEDQAIIVGKGLFQLLLMQGEDVDRRGYSCYPCPCKAELVENRGYGEVAYRYEADVWSVFVLPEDSAYRVAVFLRLDPSSWSSLNLGMLTGIQP